MLTSHSWDDWENYMTKERGSEAAVERGGGGGVGGSVLDETFSSSKFWRPYDAPFLYK